MPCDVQRHPQLPSIAVLRAAVGAAVPAIIHAHPALSVSRVSSSVEKAAEDVVRIAQRLALVLDNYRRVLSEEELPF